MSPSVTSLQILSIQHVGTSVAYLQARVIARHLGLVDEDHGPREHIHGKRHLRQDFLKYGIVGVEELLVEPGYVGGSRVQVAATRQRKQAQYHLPVVI